MNEFKQTEFQFNDELTESRLDDLIAEKIIAHAEKWPTFKAERFAEWLSLRMVESESGDVPRFTREFVANADIRDLTKFASHERYLYLNAIKGIF